MLQNVSDVASDTSKMDASLERLSTLKVSANHLYLHLGRHVVLEAYVGLELEASRRR